MAIKKILRPALAFITAGLFFGVIWYLVNDEIGRNQTASQQSEKSVTPTPRGMHLNQDNLFIGLAFVDGERIPNAYSVKVPNGWSVDYDKSEEEWYSEFKKGEYSVRVERVYAGGLCFFNDKEAERFYDGPLSNRTYGDYGWISTSYGKYRVSIVKESEYQNMTTFLFCEQYSDHNGDLHYRPSSPIGHVLISAPINYQKVKVDEMIEFAKNIQVNIK